MSRESLHVLLDLTARDLDEIELRRVLESLRASSDSDEHDYQAVDIAVSADQAARVRDFSDPSWAVIENGGPIAAANDALLGASRAGAPLLVLFGVSGPSRQSLRELERCLERDALFGFAAPRRSILGGELVAKLDDRFGDPALASLPETILDGIPEFYLVPDYVSGAVLVDADVVEDFESLDTGFETLAGAMRDLVARARRSGFRTVVSNRAIVEQPGRASVPSASSADLRRLIEGYPEVETIEEEWRDDPIHEHESLLGRARAATPEIRDTLLIDLTDLGALYNGTSESVIGVLWGLKSLRSDWKVQLWVEPGVAEFHGLERYFPEFDRVWPEPTRRSTVVLRPIQPWSVPHIERLHQFAYHVYVVMHDTILSDTRIGSPPALEKAFELLAKAADGVFYNSLFTRDRFRMRFPVDPSVDECVIRWSMHPGEYCDAPSMEAGDYLFLVGNSLPHKWLEPTIRDLSAAFPYQKIKTLGYEDRAYPMVESLPSGQVGVDDVERLYREARAIVFPSQYEGFGYPVIRGLAHGRTVIARRTDLLLEIAGSYRGPGRLLAYDSPSELVEQVAVAVHDLPGEPLALGEDLAPTASPDGYPEVAGRMLAVIQERLAKPLRSNWSARQEVFGFIDADRRSGWR